MSKIVNASEEMKNDLLTLIDKGFEEIKDKLCFKVEHNDRRPEYDTVVTYHNDIMDQFNDAKCVCGISCENLGEVQGKMFVAITKGLLETWNVTADDVVEQCISNLDNEDFELKTMWGTLIEIAPEILPEEEPDDIEGMYVLTNVSKIDGARMLMSDYVMNLLREKFGKFYILPSSIHEVLIVPDKGNFKIEELEELVRTVNDTQVEERDRLSYKVAYIA